MNLNDVLMELMLSLNLRNNDGNDDRTLYL